MHPEIGITSQQQWDLKWDGIFEHYQQDLRHAFYINAVLDEGDRSLLEMAAGSFRDMAQLNRSGRDCYGCDYSKNAVEMAKKHNPKLAEKIFYADAFDLSKIPDQYYDVTFHNGFWVLFKDNSELSVLAEQQRRISRSKMIVTVHNGHNKDFVEYFRQKSLADKLYQIRFFQVEEMEELMGSFCKKVKIYPVGKGKKYFEDALINEGRADPETLRAFFEKSEMTNLKSSERLLCVGYLD